ncbi:MAG: UDP-N-acetylmuramoyl-L-alanine--D-glutamate ligase, partial [Campylobacterota bacterium]|nr:UDP-N-acetylmuramoyl-L-alanine--D-glutamate ligase [Campylobacterota bacterium]
MRILGKGKTAVGIKNIYQDAILYDDEDKNIYDIKSDDLTVVSPGIPPSNYLVKHTKNIISDYDLFLKEDVYTIWISGTNGKTTTTQMLQYLLKSEGSVAGGNIGTPLSDIFNENLLILETSSFTLHYTNKVKPNIYMLLPISEDHISWHGSFSEYENSKLKPLTLMDEEDIAIIPYKYNHIKTKAKVYTYKNSEDLANQFDIKIKKINFKEPFLLDAVLSMVTAKLYSGKINYEQINSFIQDPHKIEEFKDKKNRLWIDDSKATNIDATLQAVKTYENKKIYLILGGDDKGVDLIPLFNILKNHDITIYTIGKNNERLVKLAIKYNIKFISCKELKKAVYKISEDYDEVKSVVAMLSPAAASLDQFVSYKQRGEKFKEFV